RCGRRGSCHHWRFSPMPARRVHLPQLFVGLYAAEEAHRVVYVYRCDSWRDSADDRLDRGHRKAGHARVAALRHPFFLAISALPRHRLDVSGGLCARGHPYVARGGQGRVSHFSPDHSLCGVACGRQFAARDHGVCRCAVFLWRAGELHGACTGVPVGREFQVQQPRQVADARHGAAYSDPVGADDVRQDSALRWHGPGWIRVIRYQRSGSEPQEQRQERSLLTTFSHAALNATLNGTSAILLAAGYAAIRSGKRELHKKLMISAFAVSTVFLVSYLVYHYRVGHVAFHGQGWIRPVYFALLLSHTLLAIVIVPLILV